LRLKSIAQMGDFFQLRTGGFFPAIYSSSFVVRRPALKTR
jgi:hypothetical protein